LILILISLGIIFAKGALSFDLMARLNPH